MERGDFRPRLAFFAAVAPRAGESSAISCWRWRSASGICVFLSAGRLKATCSGGIASGDGLGKFRPGCRGRRDISVDFLATVILCRRVKRPVSMRRTVAQLFCIAQNPFDVADQWLRWVAKHRRGYARALFVDAAVGHQRERWSCCRVAGSRGRSQRSRTMRLIEVRRRALRPRAGDRTEFDLTDLRLPRNGRPAGRPWLQSRRSTARPSASELQRHGPLLPPRSALRIIHRPDGMAAAMAAGASGLPHPPALAGWPALATKGKPVTIAPSHPVSDRSGSKSPRRFNPLPQSGRGRSASEQAAPTCGQSVGAATMQSVSSTAPNYRVGDRVMLVVIQFSPTSRSPASRPDLLARLVVNVAHEGQHAREAARRSDVHLGIARLAADHANSH